MRKVLNRVALLLLTVFIASCSDIDFKERLSAKYASPNTYVVSGYDVDQETPGYDSLSIPDLDLKIFAERKIMPELSNDLYSTVIYLGQNGIINRNYGFFVGDSTRKPCLFQIKDDTIITELLDNFKTGPIRDFCLNKNGQFSFIPKRSDNIKQRCVFSNWTYDLSLLTTDWTANNDITITGSTGRRIRIADGVTLTLNNVAIYNSFVCNGNATIVLAPDSKNLVRVSTDYTHGFMNGGQGTTLTIEGSGELTSDMSCDRDRAGIGGNNGDIIIKGGTITALGGHGGAGIGASRTGTTGKISIIGGNITAVGGMYAAGIGTGDYWWYHDGDISSRCGDIVITGGAVVARGGVEGAGIGSGRLSDCGKITISCSVDSVIAYKGYNADNSIGAGSDGTCEDIIIEEGAKVYQY
ncbi:MAG: hypothetical protein IKX55_05805 [Bacteroidaceae bacterium]|nr:hypothetical protein [Bacteroidaceae bacterium]